MNKFFYFLLILMSFYASLTYGGFLNSGTFDFTNSTAWGDFENQTTGVLNGEGSTFFGLVNHGTVNLKKCKMTKEVKSFWVLNAIETSFLKDVVICDGNATLHSCQLENLVVGDILNETNHSLATVILDGSTKIKGSIIFKNAEGKVYKSSQVIILGDIINGSIIDLEQ